MAERIRAYDWPATPLGALEHWPGELRYAVGMMLASPQVASVVVGPERVLIYNDAATVLYGDRYPSALGRPVPETWPEGWTAMKGYYDRVFAGESVHIPVPPLDLKQPGAPQIFEAFLTPVHDTDGRVIAAHMTGFEVGARLRAEAALTRSAKQQALMLDLNDAIRTISDPVDIQQTAMRLLGEHLDLSRTYYFNVLREDDDWVHVIDDAWQREPSGPSMIGRHFLSDFGDRMFEGLIQGEVVAAADVRELETLTPEEHASYRALRVVAFINVPLLRHGEYSAGFGAHDTRPHEWTQDEVDLMREVAARTWLAVERARAEAALRESEQRYHALFAASPVPFMVLAPNPPDFTITAANDAFLAATLTTREKLVGRRLFDVFTDDPSRPGMHGSEALDISLHRVLTTRRSHAMPRTRYDIATPAGGFEPHWWLAINAPVLDADGQITTIIHQATRVTEFHFAEAAERDHEALQSFLLTLSDALRPLDDADAMTAIAARLLGEHLGVNRAFCAEVEGDDWVIPVNYERGTTPLPPGRHAANPFGHWMMAAYRKDKVLGFSNSQTDDRFSEPEREAAARFQIIAALGVGLVKSRGLVAVFVLHSATRRNWTAAETSLLREVAERTWAAVERARTEAALRASEAWLAAQKEALQAVIYGAGLEIALDIYARAAVDMIGHGVRCAFYLVDDELGGLRHVAGMKEAYGSQVDGLRIGPDSFACGLATFTGTPVITPDVREEPRWRDWLHVADTCGYRAVWSFPLETTAGQAVGSLAFYFPEPRLSTPRELEIAAMVARTATIIVTRHREATERTRAEASLRESEERLRQFGEASLDVLWIRDARTLQWTYLTPAFEMIYGVSRTEALSGNNYRNWLDLILPEDRPHVMKNIQRVRKGEQVVFEFRITRPIDGEIRWMRNTDFPIRDADGQIRRFGGVGHDTTALKRIEAALRESQERLRTLIEGVPQLIWRSSADGRWTWAGPQWLDYTGQSQEESLGWGWLDAVHPDDQAVALRSWHEAIPHGRLDVEYRVRRTGDGAWRWHQTRSVPVRGAPTLDDADGAILEWLGGTTDIDDLKSLQGQQQVLVAELQHRTRNLLAVVRNVARRSVGPSPERDEYDARLAALGRVQGFLSRSTAYAVPLFEVVEAELHAAGNGASDRVELGGPPVQLPGESLQAVALALHELATNAVKYGAIAQSSVQSSARLSVVWRIEAGGDAAGRLVIDWQESGVAMPKKQPARRGYGTELITRALPYQLKAETVLEFTPDGVHCRITLPASAFTISSKELT